MIPVISGTASGQNVGSGSDINPFSNVSVTDGNDYIQSDTLTITETDASGNVSDASGKLTLAGDAGGHTSFSETSSGVYTLVDTQPGSGTRNLPHFQDVLPNLTFIPSGSGTTNFKLTTTDSYNETSTDSNTSVIAAGAGSPSASNQTNNSSAASPTPSSSSDSSSGNTLIGSGNGHQVVNNAQNFTGTLNLVHGDIDLNGLVNADSVSFAKDMLTVYTGGSQQSFHITGGPAWNAEKTPNGISIYTADDTTHPGGTVMPFHT
jgi:hypothetical protein